ncbi:MAG: alpha/beta hydrolase, partial [Sulfuriferula sp.]
TLSCGHSLRNQTLACEAVHNHSVSTDSDEIKFWVDWLAQRTRSPIALIGHSSGANAVLHYVNAQPDHRIQQAILVSVVPTKSNPEEYQRVLKMPESDNLARYTLAYCQHNYATTRANYLSYATWNEDVIIRALRRSKVPVSVLVGGEDKVFAAGWRARLQREYPATVVVTGAGHFFDGTAELDLSDFVLSRLTSSR